FCLVDSLAAVERMSSALAARPPRRPLDVLVEVGVLGGRAGCRTVEEALAVAEAVSASPFLRLAGVEAFEGILGDNEAVDAFLDRLADVAEALSGARVFDGLAEAILSAGGSAFPDRVVARLRTIDLGLPVRVVLRSGCYVTHDSGMYDDVSPFGSRGEE